MKRREFIALLGGAAAAWSVPVRAQQQARPVVGFVTASSLTSLRQQVAAFHEGLKETGFVDGQNATVEYRSADGRLDRFPALVSDLVRRQVAVIAAHDTQSAIAAKAATTTIPIVFTTGGDPVRDGLVASLNRPGGNVTGVSFILAELAAKQLGLLHELRPEAARIGVLADPKWPTTERVVSDVRAAALAIGRRIEVLYASTARDIDTVFAGLPQKPVDALLVVPSPLANNRRVQLVTLATYHRVPALYPFREAAEVGGLMSYGTSLSDAHRQAGVYTGRILKGEKPADLPVMQSIKFELVINLNTARAFGLSFPRGCLPSPTR